MDPSRASRRLPIAVAAAAFVVTLFVAAIEDRTLALAAARAAPWLRAIGEVVTTFGTSGYMFFYSALVAGVAIALLRRGRRTFRGCSLRLTAERALFFFATILVSGIAAQAIKHVVGRSRPRLILTDGPFDFHGLSASYVLTSFPSGHTTSAFAAAVALGVMAPRWRWLLLAFAALIGMSRVLVGAHYPSDVVGGAALGSLVSLLLVRNFAKRGIAFAMEGDRAVLLPLRAAAARPPA